MKHLTNSKMKPGSRPAKRTPGGPGAAKASARNGLLAVTLAVTAVAGLPLASPTALADGQALEMVVYTDSVQGRRLVNGDWEKALAMGTAASMGDFEASNNRCVSLTLAKDWDAATAACDIAVATAVSDASPAWKRVSPAAVSREQSTRQAMARTNRGVLRALQGDRTAALKDFGVALELSSRVDAARSNLAILGESNAVAQAR